MPTRHQGRVFPFALGVFAAMTLVACGQAETGPVVTLSPDAAVSVTGGEIRGMASALNPDIMAFKGVPYAAPPVGDLRWRPPEPVTPWDGIRDATSDGPTCMQNGTAQAQQSEDCLVLNVWAPRETAEPLPVMVWIHGGGYSGGAASLPAYDGTNFAANDVVLVGINYRLNVFGFFAHPALTSESPHQASGNYGLMDMVAALEWVQDNIAAFGGDPSRVTIFGESAGGGAVMSVMLIPQSEGLFHRAIAESNWVYGWDRGLKDRLGDSGSAEAQGLQIAEFLGATGETDLATLRSATSAEVQAAANAGAGDMFTRSGYIWAPNIDGWIIPDDPQRMYENGRQHDVPLITGMNGNEGSLFSQRLNIEDVAGFESHVRRVYPSIAEDAIAYYDAGSPEAAKQAIDHLVHDMYFSGPVRIQATSQAQVTSPVWLYHFTRVPPTASGETMGAHHAAEIVYVFGTMTSGGTSSGTGGVLGTEGAWTDTDRQLSGTMMGYWTQFAATGNPNRDGLPSWPEFEASTDRHLVLGERVAPAAGLHNEGADLFRAFESHRRAGR